MGQSGTLKVGLSNLTDRADVQIIGGRGILLAEGTRTGRNDELVAKRVQPGWYFIRVTAPEDSVANYHLTLSM